jgi:glutaredoxin-related protein
MKLLSMITLFGAVLSMNASADCLVELSGANVNSFIENDCREAMKECSKFKRTSNYSHLQCEIVDDNYRPHQGGYNGGHNGGGYNPPNNGGNGQYNPPGNTNSNDLIQDFISGYSDNCTVIPFVDGRYHQVYVRGQFKGNYDIRNQYELRDLRRVLSSYVARGQCRLSNTQTQHGQNNMSFSRLLERYTTNFYYNCNVTKDYFSNYHQLYINGQFKGNFVISSPSDRARLEYSLRSYDRNGTCRR